MTDDGHMSDAAGKYAGLDRFEARARMVADLEALGLLEKIEDISHAVGVCDRCKSEVEPRISTQWFLQDEAARRPGQGGRARRTDRSRPRQPAHHFAATGSRTFATGASRASSGGAIAFPSGIAPTARRWFRPPIRASRMWKATRAPPASPRSARNAARRSSRRIPTCSTPGSARPVAVFDARLAGRHARPAHLLSHQPADQRLRHPVLLGRPHDHDGPASHRRPSAPRSRSLPPALPPFAGAHRGRREDVQDQGHRRRSAGTDPKFGTDALRYMLASMAAPGTDIILSEDRILRRARLRQQNLECRAISVRQSRKGRSQRHYDRRTGRARDSRQGAVSGAGRRRARASLDFFAPLRRRRAGERCARKFPLPRSLPD